mmetsp:Transcript_11085/g.16143  ORF Transcript_11085/g.16143 Transcript_11085/m.16143 type:complete len:234 (+) Transcript_11085:1405-2106(+)
MSLWFIMPCSDAYSLKTVERVSFAKAVKSTIGLPFIKFPVSNDNSAHFAPLIPIIDARASKAFKWSAGDGVPDDGPVEWTPDPIPTELLVRGKRWDVVLLSIFVVCSIISAAIDEPGMANLRRGGTFSRKITQIIRAGTCAAMRAFLIWNPPMSPGILAISLSKQQRSELYRHVRGATSSKRFRWEIIIPILEAFPLFVESKSSNIFLFDLNDVGRQPILCDCPYSSSHSRTC